MRGQIALLAGLVAACAAPRGNAVSAMPKQDRGESHAEPPQRRAEGTEQPTPPSAASAPPLTFKLAGRVSGSVNGPLQGGMTLRSGDLLDLTVETSDAAHLYVLYCGASGNLTSYPSAGAAASQRGVRMVLPGPGKQFRLDDRTGSEVLYVVASRSPLSVADPDLDVAISEARTDAARADCAQGGIETRLVGLEPKAQTPRKRPLHEPRASVLRGLEVVDSMASEGDAVQSAVSRSDGIVVLRIPFVHAPSLRGQ
jgi:hypothetical protein